MSRTASIGKPRPTPEEIRKEVERLAQAAAGEWCPGGGWQFPYDFGHGITAPTYSPTQQMHIWRRDVMLQAVEKHFPGPREGLSVLDLGSGEGAMAIGLWELGFRDITCVEVRPLNIEKAQFAARVFGAELDFIESDLTSFLADCTQTYDVVMFMGILYHILDPFTVLKQIGEKTRSLMVLETVISVPKGEGFQNAPHYAPTEAAFYLRVDCNASHTAGLSDYELWPTRSAVEMLLKYAGFTSLRELTGPDPVPDYFADGTRMIAVAAK